MLLLSDFMLLRAAVHVRIGEVIAFKSSKRAQLLGYAPDQAATHSLSRRWAEMEVSTLQDVRSELERGSRYPGSRACSERGCGVGSQRRPCSAPRLRRPRSQGGSAILALRASAQE